MRSRLAPLLALVAVACSGLGVASAAPKPVPASFTHHTYSVPGGLTRGYWLYVPAGRATAPRPVVMSLHGCNQTAAQAATATRYNALADARDFVVVYPEQVVAANSSAPLSDGNGIGCWNWFLPDHQVRDSGEPAVLAGIARQVTSEQRADRTRVYVEGISAGAAMSVILAATYPDVFAAAASLAGCAYKSCGDLTGSLTRDAMGPRARVVPLLVENGTADAANPAPQSVALVQSWLGADDLIDDGAANASIARTPSSSTYSLPSGASPGSGDPCVHNNTWTCPGGALGLSDYPVTVQQWSDAKSQVVVELWLVHGMAHAQPHAPAGEPYTDPLGPDMSKASYEFFLRHHL